jgi:hypothetical protein
MPSHLIFQKFWPSTASAEAVVPGDDPNVQHGGITPGFAYPNAKAYSI